MVVVPDTPPTRAWNRPARRSVDRLVSLRPPQSRPWPRSAVSTAVGAAATAAVLLPDRIGGPRFPFVALAALRPHVTALALATAAALATRPRTRPLAAGVGSAAVASAAALGSAADPVPPTFSPTIPPTFPPTPARRPVRP